MDDFDNDGLLDLAVTSFDPTEPMAFYRNKGDGTFEDRSRGGRRDRASWAGWTASRPTTTTTAAWTSSSRAAPGSPCPMRPSLLRNNGDGTLHRRHRARPGCSTRSTPTRRAWADYDNDGWLDLFIGCEQQPNRLYHNRGDGTFEEVAARAGVRGDGPALLQGVPPGSTSTTTAIPTCSSTT